MRKRWTVRDWAKMECFDTVNKVMYPHFEESKKVHNWRNYVPEEIKLHWEELSLETCLVVLVMAETIAGMEEWD